MRFSKRQMMFGGKPPKLNDAVTGETQGIDARKCAKLRGNACASKLVFLSARAAEKFNTKPGANILYCAGEKQLGAFAPVGSLAQLTQLSKRFCACRKSGKKMQACVEGLARKSMLESKKKRRK